jgi:glycosyltransferase involved in cell wall biosynthesis
MVTEIKKILHVITGLGDGGLEKVVLMIISQNQTSEFEHFVAILLKESNTFLVPEFLKLKCTLTFFDFENIRFGISAFKKNVINIYKLANFIKKNQINIVHSHDFFASFCSRLAVIIAYLFFFFKVEKIFITLHNSFIWLNKFHHFINKSLAIITSKIICVSVSVRDYSVKHDKISPNKYQIINNGIDERLFIPDNDCIMRYKKEFGIAEDEIVIANIGVLSIRKGQKYLIESFRILSQKYKNIVLLIFGSKREHETVISDEIYKMIIDYNLTKKIKIIEPRKDINMIYNIFDIYVMPSITEGLSLCVIEAMLMERICLLSDIPSFREMIVEGENGFLFNNQDVGDLTLKLEYLINNYCHLKYIGQTARDIALIRYNEKKMAANYRLLYLGININSKEG